jgi:hypothetical protein
MQRTTAIDRPHLTAARPVAHAKVPLRSAYLVRAAHGAGAVGVLYELVFAHSFGLGGGAGFGVLIWLLESGSGAGGNVV